MVKRNLKSIGWFLKRVIFSLLHNRGLNAFSLVFLASLIFNGSVIAGMIKENKPTPTELEKLPRWCQTQILAAPRLFGGETKSVPDSLMIERARWAKELRITKIMIYTHHYAYGLNWLNRYKKTFEEPRYKGVEKDRKYALQLAISQFLFMDNYIKPQHAIFIEYHSSLAYAYAQNKEYKNSFERYELIIKYKPKYVRAYIEYAVLLNSLGYSKAAIEVLNSGLENTGSESLQRAIDYVKKSLK